MSDELCWNTTMQHSKQVRIATIPYFAGKVTGRPICSDVYMPHAWKRKDMICWR